METSNLNTDLIGGARMEAEMQLRGSKVMMMTMMIMIMLMMVFIIMLVSTSFGMP